MSAGSPLSFANLGTCRAARMVRNSAEKRWFFGCTKKNKCISKMQLIFCNICFFLTFKPCCAKKTNLHLFIMWMVKRNLAPVGFIRTAAVHTQKVQRLGIVWSSGLPAYIFYIPSLKLAFSPLKLLGFREGIKKPCK